MASLAAVSGERIPQDRDHRGFAQRRLRSPPSLAAHLVDKGQDSFDVHLSMPHRAKRRPSKNLGSLNFRILAERAFRVETPR
jgi:hypothetical protein